MATSEPRREGWRYGTDVLVSAAVLVTGKLRFLLILPVIADKLGREGFGAWTQLTMVVTLTGSLLLLGLPQSLVRFTVAGERRRTGASWAAILCLVLGAGSLVALLFRFLAGPLALLVLGQEAGGYAPLFAAGAPLVPLGMLLALNEYFFFARKQIKVASLLVFLDSIGELGSVYGVLLGGGDLVLVATWVVRWKAMIGVLSVLGIWLSSGRPRPDFLSLKGYLGYGLPLTPSLLAGGLQTRVDRLIIGNLLGPAAVGLYAACRGLGFLLQLLFNPLQKALTPYVANFWDENRRRQARRFMRGAATVMIVSGLPAAVGLLFVARETLAVIAQADFAVALAGPLAALLAVCALLRGLQQVANKVFFAEKKTWIVLYLNLVMVALNVGLNLWLIPRYDILGAAVATIITYLAALAVSLSRGRSLTGFWALAGLGRALGLALLATAAMGAALHLGPAPAGTAANLAGRVFFGLLFYSLPLVLLGGGTPAGVMRLLGIELAPGRSAPAPPADTGTGDD